MRELLAGYDRRSAIALGLALTIYVTVGYTWRHLIRPELGFDYLLAGIWLFMTALLCWRLEPRADLRLLFIGLCGGAVIEWWGTTTELWRYFSKERPPPWIIPAWPAAALTIHRLPVLARSAWPRLAQMGSVYYPVMILFILAMSRFMWISIDIPSSQVVLALMLGVTFIGARPDRDMAMFITGAALGYFLEYWGTSRKCWNYFTREVPPYEAVLAHGFAAVAFARADQVLSALVARSPRLFGQATAHPAGGSTWPAQPPLT